MTTSATTDDHYLPLSDLQAWIVRRQDETEEHPKDEDLDHIPTTTTWTWLQKAEHERLALQAEMEEQGTVDLFADPDETTFQRVHKWTSSRLHPDGVGGFESILWKSNNTEGATSEANSNHTNHQDDEVSVIYVVSEQGGGFGDIVWASSRWLANLLAHADTCRDLLCLNKDDHHHPLNHVSFLELGAGAAIPSLVALQCGARVVCTDQGIPDRIRCMAEGMERTRLFHNNSNHHSRDNSVSLQGQVLPYGWGEPVDALLLSQSSPHHDPYFRVIVAADCCYMPWLHHQLLSSIQQLLDPVCGVALLTFALHGNTDHDSVWNIVAMAHDEFEFQVEQLPSQQLTPPKRGMGAQQGLVHVLRLTRYTK